MPQTPCSLPVRVVCPECNQALQVEMEVTSELTATEDMDGDVLKVLKPKVKTQKITHMCNQMTMDDIGDV